MPRPNSPAAAGPAPAPLLLVPLDAESGQPLHRQLYDGLREAILAGRLAPGSRLPSTRTLAKELGVARATVALAFDQLRVEGYVVGRRGGGTRVRSVAPDVLLNVASSRRRGARTVKPIATPPTRRSAGAVLSQRGRLLAEAGAALVVPRDSSPVPFRLGVPAVDAFPANVWSRLTARRWRRGEIELGEGHPAGEPALREAIAEYVANARGVRCTAEQVVIVSGTQQALDLTARVLLDVGDGAWLEDPGYGGALAAITAAGARAIPVPVDDEGLNVAAGEQLAPTARLAYVTPSHQFPLGAVMSAPRRIALLDWGRRASAWIIEDDYDSEFRYSGRPLPCLQGLDVARAPAGAEPRVLYVGSFNKTLAPGLRLAYLIVPDALVDGMLAARAVIDRYPPSFLQGVVADFVGEGHYARHLRRLRTSYAERQAALFDAAAEFLGGRIELMPDPAGLHLVGWLPPGVDGSAAAARAAEAGIEVYPLSRFRLTPAPHDSRDALLLGYAALTPAEIRDGARALAACLDALMPRRAASRAGSAPRDTRHGR